MKKTFFLVFACFVFMNGATGQSKNVTPPASTSQTAPGSDSGDLAEMRADVQRLRVLLNQMRSNLAFVQTSQTPLKHQFELEADAWQVVVDQMDRRLKQMEERHPQGSH